MVGEHIDPKAYTSGMKNLIAGKAKKMKPLWYPGGYGSPVPRAAVPRGRIQGGVTVGLCHGLYDVTFITLFMLKSIVMWKLSVLVIDASG